MTKAVRRLSASIHTAPNVLTSGSFLTLLNVLRQLTHLLVMLFQVLLASEIDFRRVFSQILSNFFGAPERFLSSSLKSLYLKRRNQSLHVVSDRVGTRIPFASAADSF